MSNNYPNIITDKSWELKLRPTRIPIKSKELLRLMTRWQGNNSANDLGFIRFGFDLFPHTIDSRYGLARWTRPSLAEVLTYKPGYKKIDRAHAICTYRDGSKTTWYSFALPLYLILIGQYGIYWQNNLLPLADYIRMRAKNMDKAQEKLSNVVAEFSNNEELIALFGDLEPTLKEVRQRKLKIQAKLLMLRNNHILQAQGISTASRGANLRGRRPKVDIADDVENIANTKTESSRQWNAREILGEQFGGLALNGLSIYIGNLVHKQCLMTQFLKSDPLSKFYTGTPEEARPVSELDQKLGNDNVFRPWKTQYYQITYFDEKGIERSDWPRRLPVKYVKGLERWFSAHPAIGGYKIFRLEYYNEIVSDKDIVIKYVNGRLVRKNFHNYLILTNAKHEQKILACYVVVSGDPAISQEKRSSDRAIAVTAFASNGKRYIVNLSVGKFDIRDRYYTPEAKEKYKPLALTPEAMGEVKKVGMVEEMARNIVRFHADGFVLENAGVQLAWYNDLKDLLDLVGYTNIDSLPYHPKDEKTYKLETGLLNWWEADRYRILSTCNQARRVVDEMRAFPEGSKDTLDSLFNAEQLGQAHIPKPVQYNQVTKELRRFEDDDENDINDLGLGKMKDVEPWILF